MKNLLAGILGTTLLTCAGALSAAAKPPLPSSVQDPQYGEVLYYFHQRDFFNAITALQVAQRQERLPHHAEEAELLGGGMYLSYGMHRRAQQIFDELLERENVAPSVRERAWFYVGKIAFARGHLDDAEAALSRITDKLPPELEAERKLLLAEIALRGQRYDDAKALLADWKKDTPLSEYARFNLGVALVAKGERESGIETLQIAAAQTGEDKETRALRDKANLALGFTYLQADNLVPAQARRYFERVYLEGPYSSKALLGMGWSYAASQDFEHALVFWEALRERDTGDPAVQEALLAIPYAYAQRAAYTSAATRYEEAIQRFESEQVRLTGALASLNSGGLTEALQIASAEPLSSKTPPTLPGLESTSYLIQLLASHRFQNEWQNYLDLRDMIKTLEHWIDSATAFRQMLDTRRLGYEMLAPRVKESLATVDMAALRGTRDTYRAQYESAVQNDDARAFASADEQRALARLRRVRDELFRLPEGPEEKLMRFKYDLFKGQLLWQMNAAYARRARAAEKLLRELDEDIAGTARQMEEMGGAMTAAPATFQGFGERIAAQEARLPGLHARMQKLAAEYQRLMEGAMAEELTIRQQTLHDLLFQARLQLAQVYDAAAKASNSNGAGAQP